MEAGFSWCKYNVERYGVYSVGEDFSLAVEVGKSTPTLSVSEYMVVFRSETHVFTFFSYLT